MTWMFAGGSIQPDGIMKFAALLVFAATAALLSFPPFQRGRAGRAAGASARLRDLLDALPLVNRESRFAGIWQQGELDGARVAFQTDDRTLVIYAGQIERNDDADDVYLGRTSEAPDDSARSSVVVEFQPRDPDSHYFPWTEVATKDPVLQTPAVRAALEGLSPAATNVGLHKPGGVQIELDLEVVTASSLATDAQQAVALLKALTLPTASPSNQQV